MRSLIFLVTFPFSSVTLRNSTNLILSCSLNIWMESIFCIKSSLISVVYRIKVGKRLYKNNNLWPILPTETVVEFCWKGSAGIIYYNSNLRQDVGWNKWKVSSFNAIHETGYNLKSNYFSYFLKKISLTIWIYCLKYESVVKS